MFSSRRQWNFKVRKQKTGVFYLTEPNRRGWFSGGIPKRAENDGTGAFGLRFRECRSYMEVPVRDSKAFMYFRRVFWTISSGRMGPGGVLSQSRVSR